MGQATSTTSTAGGGVGAPNLYTSDAYLDVLARTYEPGRRVAPEYFEVDGRFFRLLAHTGRRSRPVAPPIFLDMNEPFAAPPDGVSTRPLRYLRKVSHGLVSAAEFSERGLSDQYLAAPTVRWQHFGSWDEYLAMLRSRSSMLRDDQRRMRRLADVVGDVTFLPDDTGGDVIPAALAWKGRQMLETRGSDAFADRRNVDYFHNLRAAGLLTASTLRAGDRMLVAWLGAIYDRRWYGWIFTYDHDPELAKFSLGRQLLYRMLEHSHGLGHVEFDFSEGDEAYKWFFATDARLLGPLGRTPLPERGRATAATMLSRVPAVERLVRKVTHREQRSD